MVGRFQGSLSPRILFKIVQFGVFEAILRRILSESTISFVLSDSGVFKRKLMIITTLCWTENVIFEVRRMVI